MKKVLKIVLGLMLAVAISCVPVFAGTTHTASIKKNDCGLVTAAVTKHAVDHVTGAIQGNIDGMLIADGMLKTAALAAPFIIPQMGGNSTSSSDNS